MNKEKTNVSSLSVGQNNAFAKFLYNYGYHLALVPALVAMFGSLYFSEVKGFIPCNLCWYQRILMYPLSIIILVGIVKQDEFLPNYVLPFSIIGIGVSTYHYMLQLGVLSNATTCATGIPCSLRYINWATFITIPFLALIAFVMITAIMGATKWAYAQVEEVEI